MSSKSPKKIRSAKIEADIFECAHCKQEMTKAFLHHVFGIARMSGAREHLCEDCNAQESSELSARRELAYFKPLVGSKVVRVDRSERHFRGTVVIVESGKRRWAIHASSYVTSRGIQADEIDSKGQLVKPKG